MEKIVLHFSPIFYPLLPSSQTFHFLQRMLRGQFGHNCYRLATPERCFGVIYHHFNSIFFMSNIFNNRLSADISQADMARIMAGVADAEQTMPFLIGLTDYERRRLPKIRRSNRLFVEEAIQALDENQTWMPGYINPLEIRRDYALYNQLRKVEMIVGQFYERIIHTRILAGSEAFQGCLLFYRMAKEAAASGVPGAQVIVDMLSERFDSLRAVNTTTKTESDEIDPTQDDASSSNTDTPEMN